MPSAPRTADRLRDLALCVVDLCEIVTALITSAGEMDDDVAKFLGNTRATALMTLPADVRGSIAPELVFKPSPDPDGEET